MQSQTTVSNSFMRCARVRSFTCQQGLSLGTGLKRCTTMHEFRHVGQVDEDRQVSRPAERCWATGPE
jgi:hypothetical protein